MMSNSIKGLIVVAAALTLSSCGFFFPPQKPHPINCTELKRQQLYNETNMNMETEDTTPFQRQQLADLIAKNCKD